MLILLSNGSSSKDQEHMWLYIRMQSENNEMASAEEF